MPDERRNRSGTLEDSINELKDQNKELIGKLKKMETSMTKQEKKIDKLESELRENNKLREELNKLAAQNLSMQNKLLTLEDEIEALRYAKNRKKLQITGVPEGNINNAMGVVMTLASKAKLQLKEADVKDCFKRKQREGKLNSIELEFKEIKNRDIFLKEVKKIKPKWETIGVEGRGYIYINEKLSPKMSYLFYKTRQVVKERAWAAAWIFSGAIYLKMEKEGKQIKLQRIEDLELLCQ